MILKNQRHEHFAHLIVKGVSATEAAQIAGYSPKRAGITGCELMKDRNVIVRITELRQLVAERITEKTAIDKAWVLNELVENVKMAKAATPVLDSDGNPVGEYQQQLAAANRALELIGKEIGMFVDRKEIRTGPLSNLTDAQLEQLIAALDAGIPASALAIFGKSGAGEKDQGKPARVLPAIH